MFRPLLCGLILLVASGCAGRQATQRADGSYVLDCSEQKSCIERARRTCGEEGYIILGGRSNKKRYGTPGHEVFIGKDEMYIRCNRDRPADAPDARRGEWSLERNTEVNSLSTATAISPATAKPPQEKICRPGETQRCVGPGACVGGQSCLPDGQAFGPCDCGPVPTGASSVPTEGPHGDAGVTGSSP